jgi:hypothetical protein
MRSGSSAHDGRGWSSAQHPQQGRGPRPEQDVPYGPEVSWPSGFRAAEFDSGEYRALVESSYERDEYSHVDPRSGGDRRHPHGDQGHGDPGYGDQRYGGQPGNGGRAADYDPGYGDPGYADPGYDGPRGHHPPARQGFRQQQLPAAAPEPIYPEPIYPVTGAQEVYREPEPPRQMDPRLVGLRYDELRYDDINLDDHGTSPNDEPLDDEAWYAELRSNAPAQPQRSAPGGRGQGPAAQYGRTPDYPPAGNGQSAGGPAVNGPSAGGRPGGPSYGGPSGPAGPGGPAARNVMPGSGGPGPRMGALPARSGPATAKGMPRNPAIGYQAAAPARPAASFAPNGFLGAPVAQVGVLTPPAGSRYSGSETVAWSMSQDLDSGELEVLEEYESDVEYSALLADLDDYGNEIRRDTDTGTQPATARQGIGRRRGRSGDRRLWLGLGGVVVVAAAAIFLIIKFEFPSDGGAAHTLAMPDKVGSSFVSSKVDSGDLNKLRQEFVQMTHGQATDMLARNFESGGPSTGGTPQIVMSIDGHLANDDPAASVGGFQQDYPNAFTVPTGSMGGQAVCAESTAKNANDVAICAWFDNDSFGALVSPSLTANALAHQLPIFRAAVEHVAKS